MLTRHRPRLGTAQHAQGVHTGTQKRKLGGRHRRVRALVQGPARGVQHGGTARSRALHMVYDFHLYTELEPNQSRPDPVNSLWNEKHFRWSLQGPHERLPKAETA